MSDIIDRIDELIDQQLAAGEPEQGYDFNDQTYPKCPHCDRHWHGLPITERIVNMYNWGQFDDDYRTDTDDSPIICEGSEFIGPIRPEHEPWSVVVGSAYIPFTIIVGPTHAERWHAIGRAIEATFARMLTQHLDHEIIYGRTREHSIAHFTLNEGTWVIPADVVDTQQTPEIDWKPGPHNWGCELRIHTEPQWPNPVIGRALWDRCSPLHGLIRAHWDEFTQPEHALPAVPGYDFTEYNDDDTPRTGPTPRERH